MGMGGAMAHIDKVNNIFKPRTYAEGRSPCKPGPEPRAHGVGNPHEPCWRLGLAPASSRLESARGF